VTEQFGKPCIVSRTGYTGEDGLELIVRAEAAPRVWENLMLAGREAGIAAVGLGARDTLRLEAGMPLYGHELSETIDPYQAGLAMAVQLTDRSFIGREALAHKAAQPPARRRVGLTLEGRRVAREGAAVLAAGGQTVGEVTSGTFSPTFQKPIAMAYIDQSVLEAAPPLTVDIRGTQVPASLSPLPFYKRSR
jgi:aminomethyltransferase